MNDVTAPGLQNKATIGMVGKKAYLLEPGQDPIEVIITKVDQATGLILEVVIKDDALREKIINVKDKVVMFFPYIYQIVLTIIGWFKKKKQPAGI